MKGWRREKKEALIKREFERISGELSKTAIDWMLFPYTRRFRYEFFLICRPELAKDD